MGSAQRLPNEGQVRNTFIHVEGVGPVDNQTIPSMPHAMQHLLEGPLVSQHLVEGPPGTSMSSSANTIGDASTRIAPALIAAAAAAAAAAVAAQKHLMPALPPMPHLASPPQGWRPGMEVVIEGLAKCPAFNGRRGVI